MNNSVTRGKGKAKHFAWEIDDGAIHIEAETFSFSYSREEVTQLLNILYFSFQGRPFRLANNVDLIHKGEERLGLGVALYRIKKNTTFAQKASYLGVILEELKVFDFVPAKSISWKINAQNQGEFEQLKARFISLFD